MRRAILWARTCSSPIPAITTIVIMVHGDFPVDSRGEKRKSVTARRRWPRSPSNVFRDRAKRVAIFSFFFFCLPFIRSRISRNPIRFVWKRCRPTTNGFRREPHAPVGRARKTNATVVIMCWLTTKFLMTQHGRARNVEHASWPERLEHFSILRILDGFFFFF